MSYRRRRKDTPADGAGDSWYFAYGSNLDVGRKIDRTGPIRVAQRARLPGYGLAFNQLGSDGTGRANIIRSDGAELWGVAYLCSSEALAQLDGFEGALDHYARKRVTVFLDSGDAVEAIAYIARGQRCRNGLRPSPEYLQHVLAGAKHHRLPSSYVKTITALA